MEQGPAGPAGPIGAAGQAGTPARQGRPSARPPGSTRPIRSRVGSETFDIPRAGNLLVTANWADGISDCASPGLTYDYVWGLYVDGAPVPGSGQHVLVPSAQSPRSVALTLSGVIPVTAGEATVELSGRTVNGTASGDPGGGNPSFTVVLLGS